VHQTVSGMKEHEYTTHRNGTKKKKHRAEWDKVENIARRYIKWPKKEKQ
jgi:hypothetical protein